MSPLETEYGPHAAQMKRAFRNAKNRCGKAGVSGKTVTVRFISLVSTDPLLSGLSSRQEVAIDLGVDGVVFLPELAQLGIPCADNVDEYFAMQATEFVSWRTKDVRNDDEAFDILEPYYRAIMNLP